MMSVKFALIYCICGIMLMVYTDAMFFTNSKENDYPRIGKRPLPSAWLDDGQPERLNKYDFGSGYRDSLRQILMHKVNAQRNVIYEPLQGPARSHAPTTDQLEGQNFFNMLKQYITYGNDELPL